ncbi:MAG: dihydrodipicolinate synthase family protein [Kiritimatiellae bacterium]|jgi:dihydrodipicolinate synthase/N-acetylneuraminate lyase|nr:dihydrodipicolinate synthase family protein [Kiritimatiellia bacterium]
MLSKKTDITRRQILGTTIAGASSVIAGSLLQGCKTSTGLKDSVAPKGQGIPHSQPITGDPKVRGPFPILSTPFTESGAVDYEVLAKEAQFVDWCGSPGMIWPQSGDSVDLLTMDEKLKGMEVIAKAMEGRKSVWCMGVQGEDTEEMLVYAKHVTKLGAPAIISRPPDSGKTEADLFKYWRALAEVTKCPVIIQTSGGGKAKPSVKLLIQLAKESQYFGYVKEEVNPIQSRMRELVAAKPTIRRVMSAMGGFGWLYQTRQIGCEGLVTERAVYADLLADIWRLMQSGEDPDGLNDRFSKLLLMLNLKENIGGNQLRGFHLYVWQKRGIFKNRLSRNYGPKKSIPKKPIMSEQKLTKENMAEIDSRFETLKPYLKPGKFSV